MPGEFEQEFGALGRAIDTHNERKEAALRPDQIGGLVTDEEGMRRVFSGLDLDIAQLNRLQIVVAEHHMLAMVTRGVPLDRLLGGIWIEGICTGVTLEQQRQRDRTQEEA